MQLMLRLTNITKNIN